MKFNINDYPGNFTMHCKTEAEDLGFRKILHDSGRTWNSRDSYLDHSTWDTYKKKSCIFFNEGMYGDTDYAKENDYVILEWSNFSDNKVSLYADMVTEMKKV